MGELLRTWWPILVLAYVPHLVLALNRVVYTRALRALDIENPDDLPYTAGEWLAREIERLGLSVGVIVTDEESKRSRDAFLPQVWTIQLDENTYFKRDPVHWAIAAHELGHARFLLAAPILGRIILFAVFARRALVALGLGVAAGNVLYAIPGATSFAFVCLASAAGLQVLVLLDEAVASWLGTRLLRASPDLAPHHLAASRKALVLAFSTYLFAAVSRAALLTQWHLVERLTAVPRVPPTAELTGLGRGVAVALSIVLATIVMSRIPVLRRVLRLVPLMPRGILALTWKLALAAFLWLVWDHRADAHYAWCAMATLVMLATMTELVLTLPMTVVHTLLVGRVLRWLYVEPTVVTDELVDDRRAGRAKVRAGNSRLDELIEKIASTPPLAARLVPILELAFVPLLVAFWLS